MRALLISALLCLLASTGATAQPSRWQAFPSLNNVQAVAASDEALWAGTDGGVFSYAPASGELTRYTRVEGLSGVNARAVTYDAARRVVWIGYADGVLDRLHVETGAVASFVDIARADRFNARGINRIEVAGDSLRIATDFGLVTFDAARNEVRDTYERFGTLPIGTATYDVLEAPLPDGRPGLWVATRNGVARAALDTPNLREPAAWTVETRGPRNVLSLAAFGGEFFAGLEQVVEDGQTVEGGVRRRNADGTWSMMPFGGASTPEMLTRPGRLYAVSTFTVTGYGADGEVATYRLDTSAPYSVFQAAAVGPNGSLWLGDRFEGLIALPELAALPAGDVEPVATVIPQGPASNTVLSVEATPEAVWIGLSPQLDRDAVFARFDGSRWTNYSILDSGFDRRAPVRGIVADRAGDVWLGSEGAGVYQVTPEDEIVRYSPENSSLVPSSSSNPNFLITDGLAVDRNDHLWVTNLFASPPLHVRTPEGAWQGLTRPGEVPSTVTFRKVTIDSFGYKWLTTQSTVTNSGAGLAVLDTGTDPLSTSDDRAVYVGSVGSVGTGLPSERINAIAEDRSGRIWLGTERGLATVFSPGSIFSGNAAGQITWARTPEQTDFFLRDLRILDIAVDPADRKWLASESGAWLLNPAGNEVIATFTTENSPLPSDVVVDIDIDEADGTVYFATSSGLYSYRSDATAPVAVAGDLFVYPNPVRAEGGALPGIAITGLVDHADVRVLTVDGQVVAAFSTRGGSVSWDGRDQRTGEFVPSGVYIVAADGEGGTAYGKVAVIR